jgi:hypothetical protein
MRYRLRTLLIVLALGPPLLAGGYWGYWAYRRATMTEMDRKLEEVSQHIDEWIAHQKSASQPAKSN